MTGPSTASSNMPHERDNCQVCIGLRGGVPGNENRQHGFTICDYCSARHRPFAVGQVNATDVAMHQFALTEQLAMLRRELSTSPIPREAEHLLRQMSAFLKSLGTLPVLPAKLPWTQVTDALPGAEDQILAMTVDGKVRDTYGAVLHAESGVAGDSPAAQYTHWTLKPVHAGVPKEASHV